MLTKVMQSAIQHYRKNPSSQTIPIYSFDKDLPVRQIGWGGWTTAFEYDDGTGMPTVLLSVRKTGTNPDKTKDLLVKLNEQGYRPHIPIIEKLDQFTKKGSETRALYKMPLYDVYAYNDVTDLLVEAKEDVYLTSDEKIGGAVYAGKIYRKKYLEYLKTFIDPNNQGLEQLPSVIEDLQALSNLADKDEDTSYVWDFEYHNLAMDNENKVILLDVLING